MYQYGGKTEITFVSNISLDASFHSPTEKASANPVRSFQSSCE